MRLIEGAQLLAHCLHTDARGDLVAFEEFKNLPFPLERVFFIKVDAPEVVRGGHANSCDELIVALSGSVLVEVDNGREQSHIRLCTHDQALWVRAGVIIHLREFVPGTLILVCASARYEDTRHYSRAQPHLMRTDCYA
ncbi:WxcM-like domain-containing protein [Methylobacterium sp. BTF04]|nr:WxcM-like domain-containing protein [Methylobacterium sp. BTF04]